jgi:hypothetical protein
MTPVTAAKVKYGVWGLICGAIIAMIIGFAWGGWRGSLSNGTKNNAPVEVFVFTCLYSEVPP